MMKNQLIPIELKSKQGIHSMSQGGKGVRMWSEEHFTLSHVDHVTTLPAQSQQHHSISHWSPCTPATLGQQQIHLQLLPP